jgi:hypothetical protein
MGPPLRSVSAERDSDLTQTTHGTFTHPHRIESNPELDFLVIVNPNSGPGTPDQLSPDKNYAREVPRLNAYANVYTVGYIRIDYCRKPFGEACDEIARYAGWAERYEDTKLGVRGIFVDETPNHDSEERVEYLEKLAGFIKGCDGILGDKFVCFYSMVDVDVEGEGFWLRLNCGLR